MKNKFTLFAVLAGCTVCVTICGDMSAYTSKSVAQVNEITFRRTYSKEAQSAQMSGQTANGGFGQSLGEGEVSAATGGAVKAYEKIVSHAKIQSFGGTIQIGEAGYELYNYVDRYAARYADIVNTIAQELRGTSQVYDMVIPTSLGITLPDNKAKKINSTNQGKAAQSLYDKLNHHVIGVPVYDILMQHRTEYVYFRTDHHWTQRGAYYAYQAFCQAKGIEQNKLSDYKTRNFGPFLGTFYQDTNQSKELRIDNVRAYYPLYNEQIKMTYIDEHGGKHTSSIICDATDYSTSLKYCAFLAGDNPYSLIQNKALNDDSTCIVVKESYANSFVPFLADHYQKIYVIDYRYWTGSITELAQKVHAQDVIFFNNISTTRNTYLLGRMAQVK